MLDLRTNPSSDDIPPDDPSVSSRERQISAKVIAELLLSNTQGADRQIRRLHLVGARITGRLDLRYARILCPIIIERCFFEEPVDLSHAQTGLISLEGCRVRSVTGYALRVDGDINCTQLRGGTLDLFGTHISGRLWLSSAQLMTADERWALNAPEVTIEGGMYCDNGFKAIGGVNLFCASIGSTLEFNNAILINKGGLALRAPGLTVRADMSCTDGFSATGGINLFAATIGGQLWCTGAHLDAGDTYSALDAPQLKVGGGLYCNMGFKAEGRVNLFGATIGSTLEFDGATLTNPDGSALRAPNLAVKTDMSCTDGFTAVGAIDLAGAHIGGQLMLERTDLSSSAADLRWADIQELIGEPSCWPAQLHLNQLTYRGLGPYLPAREPPA